MDKILVRVNDPTTVNRVYILALVLSLVMSGCSSGMIQQSDFGVPLSDCVIAPIGMLPTLNGIIQAANGVAAGSLEDGVVYNAKLFIFYWRYGSMTEGFVMFTRNGQPIAKILEEIGGGGQRITVYSWQGFLTYLQANGWTKLTPALMTAEMAATLNTIETIVTSLATEALPSVLIFPIAPELFPAAPTPALQ